MHVFCICILTFVEKYIHGFYTSEHLSVCAFIRLKEEVIIIIPACMQAITDCRTDNYKYCPE
jgi:hypothetical protein